PSPPLPVFRLWQQKVGQFGPLRPRRIRTADMHPPVPLVLPQKVDQPSLARLNIAFDNCPVDLLYISLSKLLRQPRGGLRSARKQDDPRHWRVETADNS